MAKSKLPAIKTVVVEDENPNGGDNGRADRIEAATKAFFYHVQKQELTLFDTLVVLAGAFKLLQRQQASVDEETQVEVMFLSMIDRTTVKPSKN